ncbi:MAG: phosphoribosyl-AMP cyclohydrolase [Patescibacteria group bacterium]|mgnify:CR=1 FL=1
MSELRTINDAEELNYGNLIDPVSGEGIVPVVCIDTMKLETEGLAAYRMQAYATRFAMVQTLGTGIATFWSRSRQGLWVKGAESGNFLIVRGAYTDCDADSVLLDVEAMGPSCHTGANSCFEK